MLIFVGCLIGCVYSSAKIDICHNQEDSTFLKDYSDCKGYIACVNGHSMYGSCPDKLLFNSTTSTCDFSENVQCSSCPRAGVSTFKIEGSCRKYVRCIGGKAEYMECPSNLYYDKTQDGCNLQSQVDCDESICEPRGVYLTASREDCGS